MRRKDFLRLGTFLSTTAWSLPFIQRQFSGTPPSLSGQEVDFIMDGLILSPHEYGELLMRLADEGKIKTDFYSNGGVVEELENKFATLLGKESAVWMPTGTLANHIAIRHLAGPDSRVIVQEQSHVYQDTGDSTQSLSQLNLIPLGLNAVSCSLEEIREVIDKTAHGRVETHIGVISIETPVRRKDDRVIPLSELQAMTDLAKANGIRTHLDGARLFIQSVHTNSSPAAYAALFDTAYVSMWKCFNSASGAILAGTKLFTEKLFHERRMFGGGLPAAWPFAAIALHYADTFLADYAAAWKKAGRLFFELESSGKYEVTPFENGSHIIRLDPKGIDPVRIKEVLKQNNIQLPNPDSKGFKLKVNVSLNRMEHDELRAAFMKAVQ